MTSAFRRPYWKVSFNVAIVWWCVSGLAIVAAWTLAPAPVLGLSLGGVVLVSLGSGLVAALAIAPGLIVTVPSFALPREGPDMDQSAVPCGVESGGSHDEPLDSDSGELSQSAAIERIGQAFLAGMLIRLAGTVALFMASSYYLDPSGAESVLASIAGSQTALRIAVWVLGWHAILLLAEVVSLVREIKQ